MYRCDAMIWSSPTYHGSVSGSFKNALDWLILLAERTPPYLSNKPIGMITTAGGVQGLQARHSSGEWLDVPPREGSLAVNFGKVLERWCGGRINATEHRVIGAGRERMSIPFFYEARADAETSRY